MYFLDAKKEKYDPDVCEIWNLDYFKNIIAHIKFHFKNIKIFQSSLTFNFY